MADCKRKEVDSFTIGGTKAGPSVPGFRLQRLLGTRIGIDIHKQELHVPTPQGVKFARRGDRIILYSDDTLEVEERG